MFTKDKGQVGVFNPLMLAANQVNGFTRFGSAAKKGKSRRLTKIFTLGLPLFFSRLIFLELDLTLFPYKVRISEQNRRVMTKKSNKIKKSVININLPFLVAVCRIQ